MKPTLDVAISTLGPDGIARTAAMELPRLEGVRYIVSWQTDTPLPLPEPLQRPDVEVHAITGRGLSRNRNNALAHTRADVVLIADDDLSYTPGALKAVAGAFAAHPGLDFATFRYDGADHKTYPATECDLRRLPRGYFLTSFELALRRRVIDDGIRFDERFGLGSPLGAGEEELLLATLRRRGYRGRFFPVNITTHHGPTTGMRPASRPGAVRALGAYIGMAYPLTGAPRVVLKAWRMSSSGQMALLPALAALGAGWVRQLFMKRPWKTVR